MLTLALQDIYVQADMSWKSGQLHKDDILAVDYCPALGLLATGSFDGEMIIWNLRTQRPLLYLQRAQCTRLVSNQRVQHASHITLSHSC